MLASLLHYAQVQRGHQGCDDLLEDYVDGTLFKHHPLLPQCFVEPEATLAFA